MTDTAIATASTIRGPLSPGWRHWLTGWCAAVVLFGLVLAGAAFPATDAPTRALLSAMGGIEGIELDRPMRFAFALMGAVTLGWALTLAAVIPAIERLDTTARRVAWRRVLLAVFAWYAIDSSLSIATEFALNAVSNTVLMIALLIPLVAGGALGD